MCTFTSFLVLFVMFCPKTCHLACSACTRAYWIEDMNAGRDPIIKG